MPSASRGPRQHSLMWPSVRRLRPRLPCHPATSLRPSVRRATSAAHLSSNASSRWLGRGSAARPVASGAHLLGSCRHHNLDGHCHLCQHLMEAGRSLRSIQDHVVCRLAEHLCCRRAGQQRTSG